jgi:hypothetical protein
MSNVCHGGGTPEGDHCCYVAGERCAYLVENVDGRRWACGLMVELGSWDLVHADPRYAPIQAEWDKVGIESCGAWGEGTNQCCYAETPVVIT